MYIRGFIKSIYENACIPIEKEWPPPTTFNEDKVEILKSKNNWRTHEARGRSGNTKVSNVIFGGVVEI